jgi:hypothetical protein
MSKQELSLGECCACRGTENVRNIVAIAKRGPVSGKGWGCVVCGLPMDGAISVVCDSCLESKAPILEVCYGVPKENRRLHIDSLSEVFEHNMGLHAEEERRA